MPEQNLDRGRLLLRGALLLGSGGALAALARPAAAAGIPDGDLAYLRLLIAVELLKVDYGMRASTGSGLAPAAQKLLKRVVADDKRHYAGLAALFANAGQTPATGDDVDFSYPRGSFASGATTAKLGRKLSMLSTGAYLGALENVETPALRLPLAQIAANEAQQAGAFAQLTGGHVVGSAFAPSLQIDAVSAALDQYES
jgi:hypothetical protein